MAKDGKEDKFSRWRHPIGAFRGWLGRTTDSNRDALLAGALGAVLFALFGAIVGFALTASEVISFEGHVPALLAASIAAVALGLGSAVGALAVRHFYHEPKIMDASTKLETAEDRILELEPHRKVRLRIESYAEHVRLLGTGLKDIEEELIAKASQLIKELSGVEVHLSVWEPVAGENGGPDHWQVLYCPDHSSKESNDFAVPLSSSWIAYMQRQRQDQRVFGIGNLKQQLENDENAGKDLDAFDAAGFESVQCSRIVMGATIGEDRSITTCLLALAKEPDAFSTVESRYLQFLGQLLSTHFWVVDLLTQLQAKGEPSSSASTEPGRV